MQWTYNKLYIFKVHNFINFNSSIHAPIPTIKIMDISIITKSFLMAHGHPSLHPAPTSNPTIPRQTQICCLSLLISFHVLESHGMYSFLPGLFHTAQWMWLFSSERFYWVIWLIISFPLFVLSLLVMSPSKIQNVQLNLNFHNQQIIFSINMSVQYF